MSLYPTPPSKKRNCAQQKAFSPTILGGEEVCTLKGALLRIELCQRKKQAPVGALGTIQHRSGQEAEAVRDLRTRRDLLSRPAPLGAQGSLPREAPTPP